MKKKFYGHANKSGVYKITNTANGKIYIGSAKSFKKRSYQHTYSLKNNKHQNKYLQASWNKYGSAMFSFEVIEVVEGDKLHRTTREEYYLYEQIKLGNWENTFNCMKKATKQEGPWSKNPEQTKRTLREQKLGPKNPMYGKSPWNKGKKFPQYSGENHPNFGRSVSKETKEKLSKSLKGKTAWNKGKKASEETRKKISEAQIGRIPWNKGVPCSAEQKRKISLANKGKTSWMKGKTHTDETKQKMRLAKNGKKGNNVRIYENIRLLSPIGILYTKIVCLTDFATTHGLNKSNLCSLLVRKRKSHKGWKLDF